MKKWMLCSLLIVGGITLFAADDRSVELWKKLSSSKKDSGRVSALMNLGYYHMYKNSDSGIYFFQEARQLSVELKYTQGLAWATLKTGEIYANDGNQAEALKKYNEVQRIMDSTGFKNYDFKIAFLSSIYVYYRLSRPDSSLYYSNLMVDLARKQKDKTQEAVASWQMAYSAYLMGNYPLALELNLRSVTLFEETKQEDHLMDVYFQIGMIFESQENFTQALENFFKSYELAAPIKDRLVQYIYMHLGVCYVGTNQLDSAMKYSYMALEAFKMNSDDSYKGALLKDIGVVHEKKGENLIALNYYRMAANHDRNIAKSDYLLSRDYIGLGNYFLKKNSYDSSLYYANQASILAQQSSVLKNIMEASELLTKSYQAKHQIDSAFKYQGILQMAKDSLFSQEKIRHIQFLSYKEDQRQKQIAEEKTQAQEERKKNLQLIGISVFIISFILFVIILGRRRIRPRTIEFFGVISLLMLFEFINLFIHPFIEVWTHHSQVEMLLILVVVAAILVPLHHRMEKWVKHSLAKKKLLNHLSKEKVEEITSTPILAELDSPI